MCRSIKPLRRPDTTATTGELEAAARQYIRKIAAIRAPSQRNAAAFDQAVEEVSAASRRLLESLGVEVEVGPDRWTPGSGRGRARGARAATGPSMQTAP